MSTEMNVLIIDDNGDDRDLFCHTVKEVIHSVNCIVADSGEAAMKFLRNPPVKPDFIFLDIHMTGMDGKECLLRIKGMKDFHRVPVIMYSELDDQHQTTIYKKLGASHFISKTSSVDKLRSELKMILGVKL